MGAEVNALGGMLRATALHWAARQGHLAVCVTLLHHGADHALQDIEGALPASAPLSTHHDCAPCAGFTALHIAVQFGHTPLVAYIVARYECPDMRDSNGMTPAMWAATKMHTSVQLLLSSSCASALHCVGFAAAWTR